MFLSRFLKDSISVHELQTLLETTNQLVLLDVREPDEFQLGHIDGAKNIPLSTLAQHVTTLPKDQDLYVICQSGMRSKNACSFLKQEGYTNIKNVRGGMTSWRGGIK